MYSLKEVRSSYVRAFVLMFRYILFVFSPFYPVRFYSYRPASIRGGLCSRLDIGEFTLFLNSSFLLLLGLFKYKQRKK